MNPYQNRTNEEKMNIYTHILGIILFAPIGYLLYNHANKLSSYLKDDYINMLHTSITFCVITTLLMFSLSVLRHFANPNATIMKRLDNIGVYWGVIGFYIPLVTLSYILTNQNYWLIWATVGVAILGSIHKLFFSSKNSKSLVILYLLFGWIAVSIVRNFVTILTDDAFWAIILSGTTWTLGGIIYKTKPFKYSHALWHLSMIIGSLFMYLSIFSILNDHHF